MAGRYPLIVLSPGFTVPRATLTSLAEELASRGHVVAAVDHAYETSGTAFPGGRVLTCPACEKADSEEGAGLVTENRARDVSFLLDRLTGRHPAWKDAGLIDPGRIAMAGHSIGGSAAVAAMATDPRIRAGIDMDGGVFSPVPAGGLGSRPFMMLGAQETRCPRSRRPLARPDPPLGRRLLRPAPEGGRAAAARRPRPAGSGGPLPRPVTRGRGADRVRAGRPGGPDYRWSAVFGRMGA
ncbi:alpha/beta hydrolase family protein [Streptomyces vinaceus]|uniref:alpha/beta hydrolase family protein n=1 Tax=Streptomyces vinaceus TaxID=1960 RepID=UPI00367C6C10